MAVHVAWTETEGPWSEARLAAVRARLPASLLRRAPAYRRWQDRQVGLLGKLLLRHQLRRAGLAPSLERMTWSDLGRPSLPGRGDFNIAHADRTVICATDPEHRLGIDVEPRRELDPEEIANVLNGGERAAVAAAADPAAELMRIWTVKEAVIKADGRGVGIDLAALDSRHDSVTLDGVEWHVTPLGLRPGLLCHLATELPRPAITLERVLEEALLEEA